MDNKVEILLGSQQNIDSVNVDLYEKIELENNPNRILEYDIRNVLSATEIFEAEREANPVYRVYGKIEYMSMLNGLKTNYVYLEDFFNPQTTGTTKTLLNSFDFYLVRPAVSGYTKINPSGSSPVPVTATTYYINENFDNWVTASPSNYPNGWGITVTTGSYAQQASGNRARLYFDNNLFFTTPWNFITLYKDVSPSPLSGQFFIETNISSVSPAYNPLTDSIIVSLANTLTGTLIQTIQLTTGYQKIGVNLPAISGITRISIFGNSDNKSFYMDYFKVYKETITNPVNPATIGTLGYARYFTVIATPSDFELFPVGFSNNVYGEQAYAFNFNKDFDVSNYVDEFGFPATELFLYAQYKLQTSPVETIAQTLWSNTGVATNPLFSPTSLNIDDYVKTLTGIKIGDLIEYAETEFYQAQLSPQTFYIKTPYIKLTTIYVNVLGHLVPVQIPSLSHLQWKYNPFIPLRLRYFDDEVNKTNINSTSYEQTTSIPNYATEIVAGSGNYVWRNILPQGYTNPLTGTGVDYPFVNKKRYLFSNIVFDITPDLNDTATLDAFSQVWFSRNASKINTTLTGDINNIGKPCL